VLRFENLSADPALDWMGRALSETLAFQLGRPGEAGVIPPGALRSSDRARQAPGISSEHEAALAAGANRVLYGYFTRRGQRIELVVIAEGGRSEAVSASGATVLAAADAAARRLAANARPFATRSEEALQAYVSALEASEPEAARAAFERAAAADPNFGHPSLWQALGEADFFARRYRSAAAKLLKAHALEPSGGLPLNSAGYALAWAGDLEGAKRALEQYGRVAGGANPLDSLGDVHLRFGRFEEARRYYLEAFEKDPQFLNGGPLLKAVYAELMAGRAAAAGDLMTRYLEVRTKARDPLVEHRRAEWEYMTGQTGKAAERLERHARSLGGAAPELAALAYSELAVWELLRGDRARARRHALDSGEPAMLLLTEPPASAAEWAARAERLALAPAAKRQALVYGLLLSKNFRAAARELEQLAGQADPASEGALQALLAWALVESGQPKEAARRLQYYPVPEVAGPAIFGALWFPRILELRALLLNPGRDTRAPAASRRRPGARRA